MSSNENDTVETLYSKLCLDLNMDIETKTDAWRSYEHIRKHYVLEGDQLQWLAVSLYVSCRKSRYLAKSIDNNPISISRLLKSANNLELIVFFDKLHKWEDMANLPDQIRSKIDQVEHAFNISSIIFEKYPKIFLEIFGGNHYKLIYSDYQSRRTSNQINPKLHAKSGKHSCSHLDLYSLIWTIYALMKTIYPSTINDLIASFHLLISSFIFVYDICKTDKLDHLLKGSNLHNLCSYDGQIVDKLCEYYNCSAEMCQTIIEQHLRNELLKRLNKTDNILGDANFTETIRDINRQYDEIVLTNCIIDERIFLENNKQLNDYLSYLNENRNSKSYQFRTPLTANQHLTTFDYQLNNSNLNLTPISQANQLIQLLHSIVQQQQQTKPSLQLINIIKQQTYLDNLLERLKEWENIFYFQYDLKKDLNLFESSLNQEDNPSKSTKDRFQLSLKLFYYSLENILMIEKKRLISNQYSEQQIQETFHKLILNNEFLKSLLGLCLLLVLYGHCDEYHDFNWILNVYTLHGYSFLKIIQIFLKTCKQISKSRSFVKYLSSIEEIIISSMAFSNDSALWNDIQTKGILTYQQLNQTRTLSNHQQSLSPSQSVTPLFLQSPKVINVSRKLFTNSTSTTTQSNNSLPIIRSRSDPLVENSQVNVVKLSPYTMFYRKFYELVLCRLNVLCNRLYGCQSNQYEKIIWNLFLYLFENHTDVLFRSRDLDQVLLTIIYFTSNSNLIENRQTKQIAWPHLIQAYKSMPNSKLKTLRSVFIRSMNGNETISRQDNLQENPCLTPSKPAGTIHVIEGNLFGDIRTFYEEVFLKITNIEQLLENHIKTHELIDVPKRSAINQSFNKNQPNVSIHVGRNIFIDYSSSNQTKSTLLQSSSNEQTNSNAKDNTANSSSNMLSSSIQAGAHNTVRTTRTRTEDGKFLTTISTISKTNHLNETQENIFIHNNQTHLFFGQSTNNSIKRTLSDDSNSNCLTSLTKKVLQIEKDRQKIEQS